MKNLNFKATLISFVVAFVIAFAFTACGPGEEDLTDLTNAFSEAAEEIEAAEEVTEEKLEEVENVLSDNSECDEFLEGYEDFMDEYITILKKQKADPTDMSIMTEAATIAGKASEWATKTPDCTDAEFVTKLSKIQMKITNAVTGMF